MRPHRRRVAVPTDYGPIDVELDWLDSDPLSEAVQPGKARLTAARVYDGLDWIAEAAVTLDDHLRAVEVVATLGNPLHPRGPSAAARRSWRAEAIRFTDEHMTPAFTLALVRAGSVDWLGLTGRRVAALRRLLAEEENAHRGAALVHAVVHEDDAAVRIAATGLIDAWAGSVEELVAMARRTVSARWRE